jgi:ElaB/YqjD/DUF883 family membrane-anchored ribosome-binding protein
MFSIFRKRPPSPVAEVQLPDLETNSPPARPLPSRVAAVQIASRRRPGNNYRQLVPERVQKLIAGLVIWVFLAAWSISAFWEHIDSLDPADKGMAKAGAMGAEIILLFFILWKIYNKHLRVRFFALLFSAFLGVAILVHAGALRSIKGAKTEQVDKEKRFAENAGRIAGESTKGAVEGLSNALRNSDLSSRQRNRQIAAAQLRGQKAVDAARKDLKEITDQSDAKLKNASWLPDWYIEKHTYTGVFVIALTLFSILMGIWMAAGDDDVDENFDGVPDNQQPYLMQPTPYYLYPPPPQYFYVQEQPGTQPSGGQRPIPSGAMPQGVGINPHVDERGN